ncbi:hypothetical protein V6N13_092045 [Hibiscus sabdariffa]|uniref:Uncharacterized protein n=1 Tax=Hibiscus sabdariffa TaxID=183260 RepID=A0ABR2QG16_9ROSI
MKKDLNKTHSKHKPLESNPKVAQNYRNTSGFHSNLGRFHKWNSHHNPLGTTYWFQRRNPLEFHSWFRPLAHRQIRWQVNKARVSPTHYFPRPNGIRRRPFASFERTTDRPRLTSRHSRSLVDVHVAQSRRGIVQRGLEDRFRTIQEYDVVAAGDVERQTDVELHAVEGEIGGDARVRHETCRLDHQPLIQTVDGRDRIGIVQSVEDQ